jgi:formate dehydrogenase maturation protein FdhE
MAYVHYAVVNETCPICGQGRVFIAVEGKGGVYVICEDCESEWNEPNESRDASLATRDQHVFMRYLEPAELIDHYWYSMILNK